MQPLDRNKITNLLHLLSDKLPAMKFFCYQRWQ